MKRIIYGTVILLVGACLLLAGYRCYHWWQKHQKRKELFVYFKEKSPLTKKMPEDSVVYLNIYDFRRVYSGMRNTKFYQVLAHWLDTGMSGKQSANPLVGGMLEKTILNVIGEEFAVAIVPAGRDRYDFVAAAKLAPGSDFLLRLGLSSSKNVRKVKYGDETVFTLDTKDLQYPAIFVYIKSDFGYASSNLRRIEQMAKTDGAGPAFLQKLGVEPIPEDTFLFLRTNAPRLSATIFGSGSLFRMRAACESEIASHVPAIKGSDERVLRLQTNGTEIVNQPAASYLLQAKEGAPISTLLFSFANSKDARSYRDSLVSSLIRNAPPELLEYSERQNMDCVRFSKGREQGFLCNHEGNIVLAPNELGLQQAIETVTDPKEQKMTVVLKIEFHREPIRDYLEKVERHDWSNFAEAPEFYFLSCVKQVQGSIDGSNNEITAEIQ